MPTRLKTTSYSDDVCKYLEGLTVALAESTKRHEERLCGLENTVLQAAVEGKERMNMLKQLAKNGGPGGKKAVVKAIAQQNLKKNKVAPDDSQDSTIAAKHSKESIGAEKRAIITELAARWVKCSDGEIGAVGVIPRSTSVDKSAPEYTSIEILGGQSQELGSGQKANEKEEKMLETLVTLDKVSREDSVMSVMSESDVDFCVNRNKHKPFLSRLKEQIFEVVEPEARHHWDLYVMVLLVWVTVVAPFTVCFDVVTELNTPYGITDLMVTFCLALDILFSFQTAYFDDRGMLVSDRRMVAEKYAREWLAIDALSIFPFHYIGTQGVRSPSRQILKTMRLLRMLKAVKLGALLKSPKFTNPFEDKMGITRFRLLRFIFVAMMVAHWCACVFYFVAIAKGGGNDTWLYHQELLSDNNFHRYSTALYFSSATLSSVGYGDVVGVNFIERMMALLCVALGILLFTYLMGLAAAYYTVLYSSETRRAAKKQRVEEFLQNRMVPPRLSKAVRTFFNYIVDREVRNDEAAILAALPIRLRMDAVQFLFRKTLHTVSLFQNKPILFVSELVRMMKIEFHAPGDFVIIQGELSTDMYIVSEGSLAVRSYANHRNLTKLLLSEDSSDIAFEHLGFITPGHEFGEYSCLTMDARSATIVAETFCELYVLTRGKLLRVLDNWPEYRDVVTNSMMAQSRVTKAHAKKRRRASVRSRNMIPDLAAPIIPTANHPAYNQAEGIAAGIAMEEGIQRDYRRQQILHSGVSPLLRHRMSRPNDGLDFNQTSPYFASPSLFQRSEYGKSSVFSVFESIEEL